jgi:diguanylate cyclase (GGDEF)-like protein/PAS domain S-box-containing protein
LIWAPFWHSDFMQMAGCLKGFARSAVAFCYAARAWAGAGAGTFGNASSALRFAVLVLPEPAVRKHKSKEAGHPKTSQNWPDELPSFREPPKSGSEGTALLDLNGTILYASPSMSRVFGNPDGPLVGRTTFDFLHPEDVPRAIETFGEVLAAPANTRTTEIRSYRPDGSWAWIESTITNLLSNPNVRAIVASYRDIDTRKRAEEKWRSLAVTDPLTGLKNYRGLIEAFEHELQRSLRSGEPFAVLLMDMDGLKKINDTLGHLVGNESICRVATAMRNSCRSMDTAARYGGDEFAIILPETDAEPAHLIADRIEQHLFEDRDGPQLSVSIGVTSYPADGETAEALLNTADEKLYERKLARRAILSTR